jgi:quercetin dioxygenase-like cupin family protein
VKHQLLADSFEDERGKIEDLIEGPVDAVTRIFTHKGAVRGNHYHRHTTQYTYVLTGSLLVASGDTETIVSSGEIFVDRPGVPHAWKALEDTDVLVFAQGPRAGKAYEQDTIRLVEPLIEPVPDWDMVARIDYEAWVPSEDRAP